MIEAKFYTHKGKIKGFEIKGHSNLYNKFWYKILKKLGIRKKDYICSAVSAIAYMTVIGLSKVLKNEINFNVNKSGYMKCELLTQPGRESEKFFKTFKLSLLEIEKEYPGNIKVNI